MKNIINGLEKKKKKQYKILIRICLYFLLINECLLSNNQNMKDFFFKYFNYNQRPLNFISILHHKFLEPFLQTFYEIFLNFPSK